MTTALCLHCGATKFGALCPCSSCGKEATGDPTLDIAFSDHHVSVRTLEELGRVKGLINEQTDDERIQIWALLEFVSRNCPQILTVTLEADIAPAVEDVLAKADAPPVEWRSPSDPFGDGEPGADRGGGSGGGLTCGMRLILFMIACGVVGALVGYVLRRLF